MSVRFYMDVHVPRAVTNQLRLRGVDVLTSQEDGTGEAEDVILLDRATQLGRVIYTKDEDFLAEAATRQRRGVYFMGVIYAHPLDISIGQAVTDLLLISEVGQLTDFENMVRYLPL